MYLPKIINTELVTEVKKLFSTLSYKWSLLKGEISTKIEVNTKWIKIHWNETMKLGLDFLKPVKVSELLAPIIGYFYTTYPEYEKPLKEILKELDKKVFLTKGMVANFKQQFENHKFEVEYLNKELIITESYGENYAQFIINEELINEILQIAVNNDEDNEGVQDFVYSILPKNLQETIMKQLKRDYEEIYEFRVHDLLDKKFEDNDNVEIDYDLGTKDDALIVKMNHEKKYRFVIKSKNKCIIEVNGKEFAIANNMSTVKEFIESM